MSMKQIAPLMLLVAAFILPGCSSSERPEPSVTTPATPTLLPYPAPGDEVDGILSLVELVSQDKLFDFLQELVSIQPYSGWRNSASVGEAEALDYVAQTLEEFDHLQSLGLELERQSFPVYLATEIWESRLFLSIGGQEREVPANAISGHRKILQQALLFDSDGVVNDADPNPVEESGEALILLDEDDIRNLSRDEAKGKIVFLDFGLINPAVVGSGLRTRQTLVEKGASALVVVTESNHAKFAGDGTILEHMDDKEVTPLLYVRLEDLAPAGIDGWESLRAIESASLIWDTDVFSPGESGNLVARIPGSDSTRAVILGAHIDSANSPGAGDNGLNCAVLLEVARTLDEGNIQPPVDIYLVWLGSHELGFYGSQHFVSTHQDLLDRTLAAFLMDGFTADQPGPTIFGMQEASYARFGEAQTPFAAYLSRKAVGYEIPIEVYAGSNIFSSDDGPFYGFVPSVRFAFGSNRIGRSFHSPYDSVENLQDQGETMKQSVAMALSAALDTPRDNPAIRLTPEKRQRALIVASHTEVLHMTPTMLLNLDHVLAWEGFDVDVIPYGQSLSSNDVADVDLIVALPVIDYASAEGDLSVQHEAWGSDEIDLLMSYVEQGGLLVLTNSANRLFFGEVSDVNEDWEEINILAAPFGITYESTPFHTNRARVANGHSLTEDLSSMIMIPNNGLPINLDHGETLAEAEGQTAIGLVDYGEEGGQVLALSDLGMLDLYDFREHERDNFNFISNLAHYARDR